MRFLISIFRFLRFILLCSLSHDDFSDLKFLFDFPLLYVKFPTWSWKSITKSSEKSEKNSLNFNSKFRKKEDEKYFLVRFDLVSESLICRTPIKFLQTILLVAVEEIIISKQRRTVETSTSSFVFSQQGIMMRKGKRKAESSTQIRDWVEQQKINNKNKVENQNEWKFVNDPSHCCFFSSLTFYPFHPVSILVPSSSSKLNYILLFYFISI